MLPNLLWAAVSVAPCHVKGRQGAPQRKCTARHIWCLTVMPWGHGASGGLPSNQVSPARTIDKDLGRLGDHGGGDLLQILSGPLLREGGKERRKQGTPPLSRPLGAPHNNWEMASAHRSMFPTSAHSKRRSTHRPIQHVSTAGDSSGRQPRATRQGGQPAARHGGYGKRDRRARGADCTRRRGQRRPA